MHTSIGAKLFICKLNYCLNVDEPSTNAQKNGILSPSNRESWHLQAGIIFDYNCMSEGTAQSIYWN